MYKDYGDYDGHVKLLIYGKDGLDGGSDNKYLIKRFVNVFLCDTVQVL